MDASDVKLQEAHKDEPAEGRKVGKVWVVNNGTGGEIDSVSTKEERANARADELNANATMTLAWSVTGPRPLI